MHSDLIKVLPSHNYRHR